MILDYNDKNNSLCYARYGIGSCFFMGKVIPMYVEKTISQHRIIEDRLIQIMNRGMELIKGQTAYVKRLTLYKCK